MTTRILNILAPTRYPWRFNSPRQSRHNIEIRNFLPLNKISSRLEGITLFNPCPPKRFDLIHAFNRIPIGVTPFIIGFESHLPRAFGLDHTSFFRTMSYMLASERCCAIVAISEYARHQFLRQHEDQPWFGKISAKLIVRYPNIHIPSEPDAFNSKGSDSVRIIFVGNHFARKGGSVAVRLAEMAHQQRFPLTLDIVSSMEVGASSWTDPIRLGYFEHDKQLLRSLSNVRHHGNLSNSQVLSLIQQAHFLLLPTFSDSFGYSIIEAMAQGTPVIATAQCALPEFIEDNVNGILLPLKTNVAGEWKHIWRLDRSSTDYELFFDNEVNLLAEEAYRRLKGAISSPTAYQSLRVNAKATAERLFSSVAATQFWDDLYSEVLPDLSISNKCEVATNSNGGTQ